MANNLSIEEILSILGDISQCEVYQIKQRLIGIGEVRTIIEQASRMPTVGEYRLLLVLAESITFEAQQALLKVLEEPPLTTKFLFALPEQSTLLGTLLSRFSELSGAKDSDFDLAAFSAFSDQSYADRLDSITKHLAKKDLRWVDELKKGLRYHLSKNLVVSAKSSDTINILQLVLNNLGERGASNKHLLELLALSLPNNA